MDNSSILISVVIVLCIAAGVTAYGLTNEDNTVFNDLSGFTPDESGDTGIGNKSTGGNGSLLDIPGLGDGLKTVKGTALPFSLMYQCYTKDYTVYSLSRRNEMETYKKPLDLNPTMIFQESCAECKKLVVLITRQICF